MNSPATGEGRRTFLKRVAATAPILLTVAGRPAWANTCTISGMCSGNISRPGQVQCQGLSLGYWKNTDVWPVGYDPGAKSDKKKCKYFTLSQLSQNRGTTFESVFGSADYGNGATLMQVLRLHGNADPYRVGGQAVAAVLNAAYFGPESFGYTPDEIVMMYNARGGMDPAGLADDLERLNKRE